MRPRVAVFLVGLAAFTRGPLAAQAPRQASADSAALKGSWSMVSGSADGYTLPPGYVQRMRRVFSGREVTVTVGKTLYFKATTGDGRTLSTWVRARP